MDDIELLAMIGSGYYTYRFFSQWYKAIFSVWPPFRARFSRVVLSVLPLLSLGIIFVVLKTCTAPSVKYSAEFLIFYLLFGCMCLYFTVACIGRILDISWRDDVLLLDNKAALPAFAGGFLGLTLIYCGANVGDGPGWWCVLYAGGLGFAAWFVLAILLNRLVKVSEQITVDRDLACGLRFGAYLLGSGVILSRASAGDWTSFEATYYEFLDGWPVVGLAALAAALEWAFTLAKRPRSKTILFLSVVLGALYVAAAAALVLWVIPFPAENPIYH